jgi:uncharacterized DUF497 family protein
LSILFDWDQANLAHIEERGVSRSEAEEVVSGSPLDLDYRMRNGELRLRQVGETSTGRILAVITTVCSGLTRVVTAYPASRSLRATYLTYKEQVKDGKANPS